MRVGTHVARPRSLHPPRPPHGAARRTDRNTAPPSPPVHRPHPDTPAQTVRDKCFKVCVTSPGGALSGSEQKCLSRCMDRYQDATNVVTKAVVGMEGGLS